MTMGNVLFIDSKEYDAIEEELQREGWDNRCRRDSWGNSFLDLDGLRFVRHSREFLENVTERQPPEGQAEVQKVSIGRIVHYKLNDLDAKAINRRRDDAIKSEARKAKTGYQMHHGLPVHAGTVLPMIIVGCDPENEIVDGQVFLPGNDVFWVDVVGKGGSMGEWHWPPRV